MSPSARVQSMFGFLYFIHTKLSAKTECENVVGVGAATSVFGFRRKRESDNLLVELDHLAIGR